MPESPRYAYRQDREEEARETMGRLNGVRPYSRLINDEIWELRLKIAEENTNGSHSWYEIFTGPRMLYRTLLGMVLQAGQQLTGANFFFYYGTTVFRSTGISNSYITSIILGSVNVAATVAGLWIVSHCGRRRSLMAGAAAMCICFLVYSFVGHFILSVSDPLSTPQAGAILIAFTCLFIVAFATTWGPMVWAIVGELYPSRYRATCMALATASNWLFNFLISFFTTFITNEIDYFYGLVFAGCCFALFWVVFFFMIESKDRSLEEIDTMYVLGVNPMASARWTVDDIENGGTEVVTENKDVDIPPRGRTRTRTPMLVYDTNLFPDNPPPGNGAETAV
jgi:SP family sugar:H+ symporter-like MFS transporter